MDNKKTQPNQHNEKQAHTTHAKTTVKASSVKKEKMDAKTEHPANTKVEKKA